VGSNHTRKDFLIAKDVLCGVSGFFAGLSAIESNVYFPDEDPILFSLFVEWIIDRDTTTLYDSTQNRPSEPWKSYAASAWVLGMKLQTSEFQKFALEKFVETCALAPYGPWAYVESHAPSKSPLRRFADHWVAWNYSLAGNKINEFSGLKAAKKAHLVTNETRDPRTFDIDHWYMSCSTLLDPNCEHDPIARLRKIDKSRARAALAVKLPETGRLLEITRQGGHHQPTTPESVNAAHIRNPQRSYSSPARTLPTTIRGLLGRVIVCV
jgi:hypothetical protein